MNHYILATALTVVGLACLYLFRELIYFILRRKAKRKFRDNKVGLVGSNPRKGRKMIQHTIGARVSRLSWSLFIANSDQATEGVKKFAEIQGLDNTSDYIDTFHMAKLVKKDKAIYERIHRTIDHSFEAFIRALEGGARVMRRAAHRVRTYLRARRSTQTPITLTQRETIKFIHNSGGMTNDEPDKH